MRPHSKLQNLGGYCAPRHLLSAIEFAELRRKILSIGTRLEPARMPEFVAIAVPVDVTCHLDRRLCFRSAARVTAARMPRGRLNHPQRVPPL
jgi:hypothetical protein